MRTKYNDFRINAIADLIGQGLGDMYGQPSFATRSAQYRGQGRARRGRANTLRQMLMTPAFRRDPAFVNMFLKGQRNAGVMDRHSMDAMLGLGALGRLRGVLEAGSMFPPRKHVRQKESSNFYDLARLTSQMGGAAVGSKIDLF